VVGPPTIDPNDLKRAFGELRENLIDKL